MKGTTGEQDWPLVDTNTHCINFHCFTMCRTLTTQHLSKLLACPSDSIMPTTPDYILPNYICTSSTLAMCFAELIPAAAIGTLQDMHYTISLSALEPVNFSQHHNERPLSLLVCTQVTEQLAEGWLAVMSIISQMLEANLLPTASAVKAAAQAPGKEPTALCCDPRAARHFLRIGGRQVLSEPVCT